MVGTRRNFEDAKTSLSQDGSLVAPCTSLRSPWIRICRPSTASNPSIPRTCKWVVTASLCYFYMLHPRCREQIASAFRVHADLELKRSSPEARARAPIAQHKLRHPETQPFGPEQIAFSRVLHGAHRANFWVITIIEAVTTVLCSPSKLLAVGVQSSPRCTQPTPEDDAANGL